MLRGLRALVVVLAGIGAVALVVGFVARVLWRLVEFGWMAG